MRSTRPSRTRRRASRYRAIIVLGVLSLILWSLLIVVTAKYVLLLLRADNNGEGGTLSLMALGQRALGRRSWASAGARRGRRLDVHRRFHDHAGDFGIVGGRRVSSSDARARALRGAAHRSSFWSAVLGAEQGHRSGRLGLRAGDGGLVRVAAVLGLIHISDDPPCWRQSIPIYAIQFMLSHGVIGLVTLGAVFLAVTGGEALYADLGHFGRKPIQSAWIYLVLPALLINYFGQGALVLSDPRDREPVLPVGPEGAAAAGGAGDRRDRYREPGGDHGRVFADPPGGATRPAAALRGALHLGIPCRPDLPAARQPRCC